MASQTSICNLAMRKLGAGRITSIDDDTGSSDVLRDIYDSCLEAELSEHPWTFASTRALIPASSTAPRFGWAKSYPLPTGFLKMVEIGDDWCFYSATYGPLFAIEGKSILTDSGSPLRIRYVRRVTNAGDFPALFVQSFACRLAAEAAEALTQNLSKREAAWQERKQALREAKRSNDIELPPQRPPASSWELANRGWGG